jgi:hypothetical protein
MIRGFIAGVMISNAFEWVAHKYILHGVHRKGKARFSPSPASMNSHWAHHRFVRKQQFGDDGYVEGLKNERTRLELMSLVIVASATSAVAYPFSKGMALSFWYCAGKYFYVHRRAHLEPDWAKRRIPWHYDHHMNSNQDANWCVTRPWFDYVMGTRVASTRELMESNLLGMALPSFIEKPFNAWARKNLPDLFARLEQNLTLEQKAQQQLQQDEAAVQQESRLSQVVAG